MSVEQDELDEALMDLRERGYDDTFTFTRTPDKILGPGVGPVVAEVTVLNTVSGKKRTYLAGHGSSWTIQFGDDLRAGFFGSPPSTR